MPLKQVQLAMHELIQDFFFMGRGNLFCSVCREVSLQGISVNTAIFLGRILSCFLWAFTISELSKAQYSQIMNYIIITMIFYTAPRDYEGTSRLLTFSPSINMVPVEVDIFNDGIVEGNETFFGILDNQGQPVMTRPDRAIVTIVEDANDSK